MEGAVELAEEIFHMPVRLGAPQGVEGLSEIVCNPIHATGGGLLLYGLKQQEEGRKRQQGVSGAEALFSRIKSWFVNNL